MKEPPSAEQWSAGRNNKSTYLAYEETRQKHLRGED